MLIDKYWTWIFAFVVSVPIAWFVYRRFPSGGMPWFVRRGRVRKARSYLTACSFFFPMMLLGPLLPLILPNVLVVDNTEYRHVRSQDAKLAPFGYKGQSLEMGGRYIDNKTDKRLILSWYIRSLYPVGARMQYIEPDSLMEVALMPDICFPRDASMAFEYDKVLKLAPYYEQDDYDPSEEQFGDTASLVPSDTLAGSGIGLRAE